MTTGTLARNDLIFENDKSPQQFFLWANRQQVQLQRNRDPLLQIDHQYGRTMLTRDDGSVNNANDAS